MRHKFLEALAMAALVTGAAFAQAPESYLRTAVIHVKPEKRMEFDGIVKKMVEANRRNKGTTWTASETMLGEVNTIYITSVVQNYGAIDQAGKAFMAAVSKMGGPAAVSKMMQDVSSCIQSERVELRRRRPDLSSSVYADAAATMKLVGESRYTRTAVVRVRTGRLADVEEQLRAIRAARGPGGLPTFVSQSAGGQVGAAFYITTLAKSLASFDDPGPGLPKLLGEEGFRRYTTMLREAVFNTETYLNRYVPELSNPPDEMVSVAPDFWRPKPLAAPKPKAAEPPKTQ